jgi:hypothetical protein
MSNMLSITEKERDLLKKLLLNTPLCGTVQELPGSIQDVISLVVRLDALKFDGAGATISAEGISEQ